ncbi:MAG: hypothetical protein ACLRP3_05520 [Escherichia sp.]
MRTPLYGILGTASAGR